MLYIHTVTPTKKIKTYIKTFTIQLYLNRLYLLFFSLASLNLKFIFVGTTYC